MKKTFKIFSILALALGFAACSSDEFKPGDPTPDGAQNVAFASDNETSYVLGITDSTITIAMVRTDATDKATVSLKGYASTDADQFEFPKTVTFEEDQDTAYVTVKADAITPFTTYTLKLTVDDAYTNAYISEPENMPTIQFTLQRNDYQDYASIHYSSEIWASDEGLAEWDDVLQYSAIRDAYRIEYWGMGTPLEFTWDKETNECHLFSSPAATGDDWGYGAIVVREDEYTSMTYDPETKTFGFLLDVYEPSDEYDWGYYEDTFTITDDGASSARKMIARRPTLLHKMIRK